MPASLRNPGRWARRAFLSTLAGGGLTAVGLGGPLAGPALGASPPAGSPAEGASAPAAASPAPVAPEGGPQEAATTTTTTSTPSPSSSGASGAPQASASPPAEAVPSEAPSVVLQRRQKTTKAPASSPNLTGTSAKPKSAKPKSAKQTKATAKSEQPGAASGADNVALSPHLVAAEAEALAAQVASSAASIQALSFYRIPLFLLPIYKAAATQYGVPWQILAAINEIETDYGSDLSVSTAGAVGWMQFMPGTWLQYGVDDLNAGYADPYNPVDAIFAAARYLRAAGIASDLPKAILAYNHSDEYVSSVLLRAKLIAAYPKSVVASLTGLVDARLPVTGTRVTWASLTASAASSPSSATANATLVPGEAAGDPSSPQTTASSPNAAAAQGSTESASPATAAALATGKSASQAPLFVELMSAPSAKVVAVQDGRIVALGSSRALGRYVILRDVYGDIFTYASLGRIAPNYTLAKDPAEEASAAKSAGALFAEGHEPAPSTPASEGSQLPVTLKVRKTASLAEAAGFDASTVGESTESGSAVADKLRLFAKPGNPDAIAAAASAARGTRRTSAGGAQPLRVGSIVSTGTILGRVNVPPGAQDGHLRFAIRPAGDRSTIDPRPILANWAQLQAALHPQGAKGESALIGATARDVLLLSKSQLEGAALSDPGIVLSACGRHEIGSGAVEARVLATLVFLSRSGLKPTVSQLGCAGVGPTFSVSGQRDGQREVDALEISAINGVPIAHHQGPSSVTDLAIRTLLTLPRAFLPHEIISLMRYPGAAETHAEAAFASHIHVGFLAGRSGLPLSPAAVAHSARSGATAPSPLVAAEGELNSTQWNGLITRIAALPAPNIQTKPSSAAIPDPTAIPDPKVR
ncbi:MAG: lytic murein transglycosylase [Solirubrobacteraceae bacterium]|jgi:membrane-bound lytic murein transglycosylase B